MYFETLVQHSVSDCFLRLLGVRCSRMNALSFVILSIVLILAPVFLKDGQSLDYIKSLNLDSLSTFAIFDII